MAHGNFFFPLAESISDVTKWVEPALYHLHCELKTCHSIFIHDFDKS